MIIFVEIITFYLQHGRRMNTADNLSMLQSLLIHSGQLVLVLFPYRIERKGCVEKIDYNFENMNHRDKLTRHRSILHLHSVVIAVLGEYLQMEF